MPGKIRVLCWNITNISTDKVNDNDFMDMVAAVIRHYEVDIFAIIEVRGNNGTNLGTRLKNRLGHEWLYHTSTESPPPHPNAKRREQYLLLWKQGMNYLYTPTTQALASTSGVLPLPRRWQTATLLPGDQVLITGGLAADGNPSNTVFRFDAGTGAWTKLADLSVARAGHSATLLASGSVLIAGGIGALNAPIADVELYNPAGNAGNGTTAAKTNLATARAYHSAMLVGTTVLFAGGIGALNAPIADVELYDPTGNAGNGTTAAKTDLATARAYHSATLVGGKVLIAGGNDAAQAALRSVERYDPTGGGATSAAADLNVARVYHTTTLLPDNSILAAGGHNGPGLSLNSAEIYDSGSWAATALTTAHAYHSVTPLGNGQVLVAGGLNALGNASAVVEIYDPATKLWTRKADLGTPRAKHTATLLANGTILFAGGSGALNAPLKSVELYDPAGSGGNGSTTAKTDLGTARTQHSATLLASGSILFAGGSDALNAPLKSVELYNPSGGGSTAAKTDLGTARRLHTATLVGTAVWLIGGIGAGTTALQSVECYDPAGNTGNGTTAAKTNLGTARGDHTATVVANSILIAGGVGALNATLQSVELYDPIGSGGNGTTAAKTDLGTARTQHSATLLTGNRVLFTGGAGAARRSVELYNPTGGGSTTAKANLAADHAAHTATLLGNRQILIVGGFDNGNTATSTVECYGPVEEWLPVANMPTARANHSETLLPALGNKVLVMGGIEAAPGTATNSTQIYALGFDAWAAAPNLGSVRDYHTATQLLNGKILVVGGIDGTGNPSNAASIYDPTTKTWLPAANLNTARAKHVALRLDNGNVLVIGGVDATPAPLTSVELYDIATNTWQVKQALNIARYDHTATLLRDTNILVTGGIDGTTNPTASVERYDVGANTWTALTNLGTARAGHTATLMEVGSTQVIGRVLIVGGRDNGGTSLRSVELYNPKAAGSTQARGNLNTARAYHTATWLKHSDLVLVTGGVNAGNPITSVEMYNASKSGTWSNRTALNTARRNHSVIQIGGDRLVVVGGLNGAGNGINNVEIHDAIANTSTNVTTLATARGRHVAALLPGDEVLVVGGIDNGGNRTASAEIFDSGSRDKLITSGNLQIKRSHHTLTLLANGSVLAIGGRDEQGQPTNSVELFQPATGSWTQKTPLGTARAEHTATLLGDGTILIVGGTGAGNNPLQSVERYDPAGSAGAGSATAKTNLGTARRQHTATLLGDGTILIAGGTGAGNAELQSVERYDPAGNAGNGTTAAKTNLGTARRRHTATLVGTAVWLIGGIGAGATALQSVECYDPAGNVGNGTTAVKTALGTARGQHTATVVPTGILIVGGVGAGNAALRSVELYDPTGSGGNGSTSAKADLASARTAHTATLLTNDRIAVLGGNGANGQALNTLEIYDRPNDTWGAESVTGVGEARAHHTALLLPNRTLLAVGGAGVGKISSSSELYDRQTNTWTVGGNLSSGRSHHSALLLPTSGNVLIAAGVTTRPFVIADTTSFAFPALPGTALYATTGAPKGFPTIHAPVAPNAIPSRYPYQGVFSIAGLSLLLVVFHAPFDKVQDTPDANRNLALIPALTDTIPTTVNLQYPRGIVMGDFNAEENALTPKTSKRDGIATGTPIFGPLKALPYTPRLINKFTSITAKFEYIWETTKDCRSEAYDNFFVRNDQRIIPGNAYVIDMVDDVRFPAYLSTIGRQVFDNWVNRQGDPSGAFGTNIVAELHEAHEVYRTAISDHLPILLELVIN